MTRLGVSVWGFVGTGIPRELKFYGGGLRTQWFTPDPRCKADKKRDREEQVMLSCTLVLSISCPLMFLVVCGRLLWGGPDKRVVSLPKDSAVCLGSSNFKSRSAFKMRKPQQPDKNTNNKFSLTIFKHNAFLCMCGVSCGFVHSAPNFLKHMTGPKGARKLLCGRGSLEGGPASSLRLQTLWCKVTVCQAAHPLQIG